MTRNKAILSVLSQDRTGIVAAVSRILFEQDCNIENVSQTTLQTEFAGIFLVSYSPKVSFDALAGKLRQELGALGFEAHIKPLEPAESDTACPETEPFIITTRGPDRQGLVSGITEVLARWEVNISNLQAVFKGGADPDDNIMIYEVDVPAAANQHALQHELRERAKELQLHISIQHRNIFEAINRI
jgi:glycine cleavage system transcriptional repressor